jgi:hypothetical protein
MDNYTLSTFLTLFMMLFLNLLTAPIYICNLIYDEESEENSFKRWY